MRFFRHEPPARKPSEATQARVRAERELERIRAQTPLFRALGELCRVARQDNHLRESFEETFLKGKHT